MAPPPWAYQVEFFIAPPDEEMICSICRCVFCEPTECPCQHVFCKGCIGRWLNVHRSCPICRKRTGLSQLRPVIPLLNNMIMKQVLNCHNQNDGCDASFTLEGCENHLKECLYELIECTLGCGKLVFRKDISNHKLTECPFRFTKCDSCKLKVYGPWEDHDCIKALQLAAQDLEKERDKLKKELETLSTRVKELTQELNKQKSREANRLDSDWYRSSSSSDSSGFSNHIVMLHSDTVSSDSDDDTSAYIEGIPDGSASPDYDDDDDDNLDPSPSDAQEEDVHDEFTEEGMAVVERSIESVDRIIQRMAEDQQEMEDMLNSFENVEYQHLDSEADDNLEAEQNAANEEQEAKETNGPTESTVVISSSSSEGSDEEHEAAAATTSSGRYSRKRRLASPSFASGSYDCDGGNRKTQRSSSNECSNDDADLNINDNVAAYAMCSTTEQEAVPSTSTGVLAHSYYRSRRERMKKRGKSPFHSFCSKDESKGKTAGKSTTQSDAFSSQRAFEGTLSLLEQHTIDSDPEWKPPEYARSSSSASSEDSPSSSSRSSIGSPVGFLTDDDTSSEVTETDSSYELQIPPSTYDLLRKYSACGSADESDSDYVPD